MLDLSCFLGRLGDHSLVREIHEYTRAQYCGDPVRIHVHIRFDSISVYPKDMYSGLRMADADIGQSRAAVEVFTTVTEVGDTSIHRFATPNFVAVFTDCGDERPIFTIDKNEESNGLHN